MSQIEIYSGRGAYVLLRPDGSWAFAHDLLPHAWFRASGTGLTCTLRPWARLPRGTTWVPTVRSIGHPWSWGERKEPERALARDEEGKYLALAGPVRCEWFRAAHEFRLLRGEEALAAAREAVRINLLAHLLLQGNGPLAVSAWDGRVAIADPGLAWEVHSDDHGHALVACVREGRWLAAANDWVAAAETAEEAVALARNAGREFGATAVA